MKKLFLLLLIFLALGAWLGEKMIKDSGYVLVAYDQTTIETSLWVFLILIVFSFMALHWLLNLITKTRLPTAKFQTWKEHRNQRIGRRKTLKGLRLLSEGNWAQAQKQLAQAAEKSDLPMINYLSAARAAHEQNNDQATDNLLQKARSSSPEAEVTVAIAQAEIQLSRGQLEPCLATLLRLRSLAPKNSYVMKLLKEVYVRLNDWKALSKLIPILRSHQALNEDELSQLSSQCYGHILRDSVNKLPANTTSKERLSALGKAWHNLPSEQMLQSDLIQQYIELQISLGAETRAEQNLRDLIKKVWNEELVHLYGRIKGEDSKKQYEQACSWAKSHSESAVLQLSLGRLALRNQYWGQAVKYFERSLELDTKAETLGELSRLLRHLGEKDKSQLLLQKHINLITKELPALPMPKQAHKV